MTEDYGAIMQPPQYCPTCGQKLELIMLSRGAAMVYRKLKQQEKDKSERGLTEDKKESAEDYTETQQGTIHYSDATAENGEVPK